MTFCYLHSHHTLILLSSTQKRKTKRYNKNTKLEKQQSILGRRCGNTSQLFIIKRLPQIVSYLSKILHLLLRRSHIKINNFRIYNKLLNTYKLQKKCIDDRLTAKAVTSLNTTPNLIN